MPPRPLCGYAMPNTMDLEEALNRLCNLFWARNDCPANEDDPAAPLIVLHNVLQSIRTVWLDDKIRNTRTSM